jgi:arylformamidase
MRQITSPARTMRRAAMYGAAPPLASAVVAAECPMGPPAHTKGPLVFLNYDQVELDAAYDQLAYAPTLPQITKRFESNSEATRSRLGEPDRFAYGATEIEKLDVFRTERPTAPIFVYIHGGAWRVDRAANSAFFAEMFVAAGAHYVVPDFAWVQDVQGNLLLLADQVRRAIVWVYKNALSFGGDASRLYIGGHSSGGHLAGVALTTDWQGEFGVPDDFIRGGLCISGMFDLKAPRLSARSSYVKFTDEIENALSPQRHIDRLRAPIVVAYGTNETPEFQRQSRDFAEAVRAAGKPVKLLVGENYNHFEMNETLANPFALAGRAALDLMNLSFGPSDRAVAL